MPASSSPFLTLQQAVNSDLFHALGLPLLIFCARICDVTLQTVRIILLSSGRKNLAPVLGFFEVLIWIVVISQLVRNLATLTGYLAYAAGFATGTMTGIWLEQKLGIGFLLVRVITVHDATDLIARLRAGGFGVTEVAAQGATGRAHLIYTAIRRKHLHDVLTVINEVDPTGFVSVETISAANQGTFPATDSGQFGMTTGQRHGR